MRQSTLALVCGIALVIILAYSWCGRNLPEGMTRVSPTPTPAPATATPNPSVPVTVITSPSVSATATAAAATPPTQTPPPEFQKVAEKAEPAIVELTVFDAKG